MDDNKKSAKEQLIGFFTPYFLLGICLIFLSLILKANFPTLSASCMVPIVFIETIGIAIVVASVFTFSSGTSEFMQIVQKFLEDIVVSRNFLSNINVDGKKQALKSLIQPSTIEKNNYPNIGNYYDFFIDRTLGIAKKSIRSNYTIYNRIYLKEGRVVIEGTYKYRVFPHSDGYEDIVVGFENKESYCDYISVCNPEGHRLYNSKDGLKFNKINEGGDIMYVTKISFKESIDSQSTGIVSGKEISKEANHLDVEIKVTEFGDDHWSLVQFKALQPTDGFTFSIYCENDIQIRTHAIYVVGAKYYMVSGEDKKSFHLTCNQWINEGSGVSVVVAVPHANCMVNATNKSEKAA